MASLIKKKLEVHEVLTNVERGESCLFFSFFLFYFLTRSPISTSTKAFICPVNYIFRSAAMDIFLLDDRLEVYKPTPRHLHHPSMAPLQPPSWIRECSHQWLPTAGFMARIDGPKATEHRRQFWQPEIFSED